VSGGTANRHYIHDARATRISPAPVNRTVAVGTADDGGPGLEPVFAKIRLAAVTRPAAGSQQRSAPMGAGTASGEVREMA
jgi:hypothetical protein